MADLPKIAVILGAGASYDVWDQRNGSPEPRWRPPLANELFTRPTFFPLTAPYRRMQVLQVELAHESNEGVLNLEEKLLWYATHPNREVRDQFKEIPLYLRDLLFRVCVEWGGVPWTYVRLLQELINYAPHSIAVVTTNYDTLLESALVRVRPQDGIATIASYVDSSRPVRLFKLHGSIDWVMPLIDAPSSPLTESAAFWDEAFANYDPASKTRLGPVVHFPGSPAQAGGLWAHIDRSSTSLRPLYPVLTAPLAGKGEHDLVCPPEHLAALREFLTDCRKYLVAGTSGLDSDVLNLLADAVPSGPSTVHVVGKDLQDATTVAQRFYKAVSQWGVASVEPIDSRGFREYVFSDRFRDLAEAHPRP